MNWLFVLAGVLVVLVLLVIFFIGWLRYLFKDFDEFGY